MLVETSNTMFGIGRCLKARCFVNNRLNWIIALSLIGVVTTALPLACNKIGPGGQPPAANAAEVADSAPPGIKKGVKVTVAIYTGVVVDVHGKWVCIDLGGKGKEVWVNFDLAQNYQIEK
jgi:hypothetical protein